MMDLIDKITQGGERVVWTLEEFDVMCDFIRRTASVRKPPLLVERMFLQAVQMLKAQSAT